MKLACRATSTQTFEEKEKGAPGKGNVTSDIPDDNRETDTTGVEMLGQVTTNHRYEILDGNRTIVLENGAWDYCPVEWSMGLLEQGTQ